MPFDVWTVPLSLAALVPGLLLGWRFGRTSDGPLTLPIVHGFGAALAIGLLGVVLLIIFEPLLPKDASVPAYVLAFVGLALNLAVNAAPAVLAATLGFGLGARLTRTTGRGPRNGDAT